MDTPICDFVNAYCQSGALRLHMPGHKGAAFLGPEALDITEISGADSLYEASGIIAQSEQNASALFGCDTYYSAEGASLCVRAMVYLAALQARQAGRQPVIAAARNAHKSFLSAAALLDVPVIWLEPGNGESYLSCAPGAASLEGVLQTERPTAVYLTSPDYLGGMADIAGIAAMCHRYGTLLLVDNAHGAYLKFLPKSLHPMDLGADLCCDSAHKTLPVLTGGAYLHVREGSRQAIRGALALFGSTSPSYLILQSLDMANRYLEGYRAKLAAFLPHVEDLKRRLEGRGWQLYGSEPLKITLTPKAYGYTGREISFLLEKNGIFCEFADPDYLVLMLTPETGTAGIARLEAALAQIPRRKAILEQPPKLPKAQPVMSVREAMLSPWQTLTAEESVGRILAGASVGCPPAVPIAICGERISQEALKALRYYGITECQVVAEA